MSALSTRDKILGSLRVSLGPLTVDRNAGWELLPRRYRRTGALSTADRIQLLSDRLLDYGAGVYHCNEQEVSASIAQILTSRNKKRLAIPTGLPAGWLPPDFAWIEADQLPAADLDSLDGVVTASTVAIAEVGAIVLQTTAAQGPRRLSLVPDYHLIIVQRENVVETVPEALERIHATASLPTTFISGPSATADIEMTRIQGVHGPRTLDVLIAGDEL